jgi:hypothetical protein
MKSNSVRHAGSPPWFVIWARPAQAIRAVLQWDRPLGFWPLAILYALSTGFFIANFYSWGLHRSSIFLVFLIGLASPLIGGVVLHCNALFYALCVRALGGEGAVTTIRMCVAWSKTPHVLALALWLVLFVSEPKTAFIQYASSGSSLWISGVALAILLWSMAILVEGIALVESFSKLRAVAAVLGGWAAGWLFILISMYLVRYIYTLSVNYN